MESHPFNYKAPTAVIAGEVFVNPGASVCRNTLLLLHGAGVPGDLTWRFVIQNLKGWDRILLVDLPGMGRSVFHDHDNPSLDDYLNPLLHLVDSEAEGDLSVGGYSLGGMLAMHISEQRTLSHLFLIEPAALLSDTPTDLEDRSEIYLALSRRLRADLDSPAPFKQFLDTVSPGRRNAEALDLLAIERLMSEGRGLAQGIRAAGLSLKAHAEHYCRWKTTIPGCSVVGGLTPAKVHERHRQLAEDCAQWSCHVAERADHSLIYTRPRVIANAINRVLECP